MLSMTTRLGEHGEVRWSAKSNFVFFPIPHISISQKSSPPSLQHLIAFATLENRTPKTPWMHSPLNHQL